MTDRAAFLSAGHPLQRTQRIGALLGAVGLGLCALGAAFRPEQFFQSYLVAYLFWCGLALGCLVVLMIYHVTGGAWGAVIRRIMESGSGTLPLMAVLFVPLLFGLDRLYLWARPDVVAHDTLLQAKALYLNVPFFCIRVGVYFGAWILLARFLRRWSLEQDRAPGPLVDRRLEYLSRGGLVVYGLTVTFAAVDWMMSLEPHWFSTMYGLLVAGGQVLLTFAFGIVVLGLLLREESVGRVVTADQFHDLGKLLLAFVMLWAYFAFSQFLIIWAGNLPEEIPWYLRRLHGGWQAFGIAIILFHFALPFLVLLSRDIKRNVRALATLGAGIIVVRFVDLFWMITPAFHPERVTVHWLDAAALLGIGGLWLAAFVALLKRAPLLPLHDAALPEAEHG